MKNKTKRMMNGGPAGQNMSVRGRMMANRSRPGVGYGRPGGALPPGLARKAAAQAAAAKAAAPATTPAPAAAAPAAAAPAVATTPAPATPVTAAAQKPGVGYGREGGALPPGLAKKMPAQAAAPAAATPAATAAPTTTAAAAPAAAPAVAPAAAPAAQAKPGLGYGRPGGAVPPGLKNNPNNNPGRVMRKGGMVRGAGCEMRGSGRALMMKSGKRRSKGK